MSIAQAEPEEPEEGDEHLPEVPLGWKPTPREPVPVVRCTAIRKNGERCKRWSIRGYHKCIKHAGPGALMPDGNVQKYAQNVIEAARLRLVDDADMALDVINQLAQPGSGEAIRLKAATEILDRAGIRGGIEINVDMEVHASPVDEIKRRIADLKKGASTVDKMRAESGGDIVDAEIIEEDVPLFDLPEDGQ